MNLSTQDKIIISKALAYYAVGEKISLARLKKAAGNSPYSLVIPDTEKRIEKIEVLNMQFDLSLNIKT